MTGSYQVEHEEKTYRSDELSQGWRSRTGSVQFNYSPLNMRGKVDQQRFETLRVHLLQHGMINPLITFDGCVLIGMRRYEILQDEQEIFPCLEVIENMHSWESPDIVRLKNWVIETYGNRAPEC